MEIGNPNRPDNFQVGAYVPKINYPHNWKSLAHTLKEKWKWKCERCGHPHNPQTGHTLTVHHLFMDPSLCEDWNLACLCQRCHLKIQGRVKMDQTYMEGIIKTSDWFKPHLEGYLKWIKLQKTQT